MLLEIIGKIKKTLLNRNILAAYTLSLLCIFLYTRFPKKNLAEDMILAFSLLFVVPLLYVKIINKTSLKKMGLQAGNWKQGLVWWSVGLLFSLLIFYVLSLYSGFMDKYNPFQVTIEKFPLFVIYELFVVGAFIAIYEFFFKGFNMLAVGEKPSYWSIPAQLILLYVFLSLAGELNWESLPYLVPAFFGSIIALKSKSIYYSFSYHLTFVIIIDALVIGIRN